MRKIAILLAGILLCGFMAGEVGAARSGGTFNFCAPYGGDLLTLDPHRATATNDMLVIMNLHRSLYAWDPDNNHPKLELGEKVEASADGLVYRIHLKKNVKFHNGRRLTAEDIIWSYERVMSPKTTSASARFVRVIKGAKGYEDGKANKISGLRKIDDATLEITMENPVDPSYNLYEVGTAILPREEVEKKGDGFGSDPVGCGPFKFVKWVRGSEIVMAKNPDYYEKGKPYLGKLIYKIMPEGASRDVAFRAKELDATVVGSTQYPVYKADPQFSKNMVEVAELFTRLIGFNPKYEPFTKKQVRQALNYAIDSRLIIQKLLKEKAFPCVGYLPSTSPAFDPQAKGYEFNLPKAKALMKEAGYEKGFTFECIGSNSEAFGVVVVEAIMPFLKQINVTVKPQQLEGAALADRVRNLNYQAFIWSISSGAGGDPLEALRRWYSKNPSTAGNYLDYNNPEFDKLLDTASQIRDMAKRVELLRKADAIFREDAPIWFFNYNKAVVAHQPWVHGIKPVAIEMMYQNMADVWIEESSPRAREK
ncbi:MAG: ABC transporter substrate-binding protein [Deltaproteobacteria bacterium]|nr:ABC transporter substrate-binding protein [Deltaproteobacteria bacterium]